MRLLAFLFAIVVLFALNDQTAAQDRQSGFPTGGGV
jgi:hypothetical protein